MNTKTKDLNEVRKLWQDQKQEKGPEIERK